MPDAGRDDDLLRVKDRLEGQIVKEKERQIESIGGIGHGQDQSAGGDFLGKLIRRGQASLWSWEHGDAQMAQGSGDIQNKAGWPENVLGADGVPAGGRTMADVFTNGSGEGEQAAAIGGNHDGTAVHANGEDDVWCSHEFVLSV